MANTLPPFDELVKLALEDPAAFERLRQEHIEALISAAPEHTQRRLKGLQFQIDMIRRKNKSPMGACITISKMMYDALYHLREALNASESDAPFNLNTNPTSVQEKASILQIDQKKFPTKA